MNRSIWQERIGAGGVDLNPRMQRTELRREVHVRAESALEADETLANDLKARDRR